MAFSSYRTKFQGNLGNIEVKQLGELDYKKVTLKERMKYIEEKYRNISPFYESYIFSKTREEAEESFADLTEEDITEYYKVNLNTSDELSCEINIFKYCEKDASYLLNSKDLPKDKQEQYKFLSEEEFKQLLAKEQNVSLAESEDGGAMCILARKKTNDYTNMSHKITKKDLEDEYAGQVLRCYNAAKEHLKEEMRKIKDKEGSYLELHKIRNLLKEINSDMILAKIQLKGIRSPAKKLGDIGASPDYDSIDYTDPRHVKCILKNVRFGEIQPDSMLSHLAYDIEVAIKELHNLGKLDDLDMEIIECFNAGYSNVAIGKELDRTENAIRQRLDKICRRIATFYKK